MQFCKPQCVPQIVNPSWGQNCDLTTRPGGVSRLTYFKCDPNYTHPYPDGWENIENVKAAICAGVLFVSGEILGQKPKGSFTKKRLTSCSPERIVSGTKTITFQDYNADDTGLTDYDFWNDVAKYASFMNFGFITCDDRWYQVTGSFDLEIDEVIEDTSEGNSYFDGTVTFQGIDIVKPIIVAGLNDALRSFDVNETCYGYYYQP